MKLFAKPAWGWRVRTNPGPRGDPRWEERLARLEHLDVWMEPSEIGLYYAACPWDSPPERVRGPNRKIPSPKQVREAKMLRAFRTIIG